MQIFSLHKFCESLSLLLILASSLVGYAQVTCPANFSVCEYSSSFDITGGMPIGGTYSGTGVSSGKFDPWRAGVGTHLITYSYLDENGRTQSCTFNIEVRESPFVNCILSVPRPFCLQGRPMNPERTCPDPPGSTTRLTGPGIIDNIFYPASVGVGVYEYTMTVTYQNGCIRELQNSVEVVDGSPPVVTCPENMTIATSTSPPVKLEASSSGAGDVETYYWGKGVKGDLFDPNIAGNGSHKVNYQSYNVEVDEGQCSSLCSFTITVGSLPVTLTDFKAVNSESNIVLKWETVTETGFDRFEIERSQNPKNGFKKIYEIKGSDRANVYTYLDSHAEKGVPNYYRLKMVDFDGSFAYSTIVWALVEGTKKITVFPNPVSKLLTIESPNEMVEIRLINAAGKQVYHDRVDRLRSKKVNLPTLSAGIYLLQVIDIRGNSAFSRVILN